MYDSMNLMLTSTLKKILADLLHTENRSITVEYMNMQWTQVRLSSDV